MREVTVTELLPIFRLIKSASKDDSRINICGVHFDLEKGIGLATNGHLLSECVLAEFEPIAVGEKAFIPPEACKMALKIKETQTGFYKVEFLDKKIAISGLGERYEFPLVDATFPDTAPIWPKEDKKPIQEIGLDPELLLAIADSLRENKRQKGVKLLIPGDNTSPIGIKMNGQRALLMPMRL